MSKVAKFGGSSLAGAEQFRKVRDIVAADPARRCVVVSAAGKRTKEDNKITDLLYLTHAHLTYGVSCDEIFRKIEERFLDIRDALKIDVDLESEFAAITQAMQGEMSVDDLVSRGEYLTARLMAAYLGFAFVDAAETVFFQYDGTIDYARTDQAIARAAQANGRFVMPGFYGAMPDGTIHVMTRGGSDITGALAAHALDAEVYENWTDVSGILMADPRIVENPRPIERITYAELREMSYMGASVLHEESILPVKEKNIPLNIRNTNDPAAPGTMIQEAFEMDETTPERFITGIAGRKSFTLLTIGKKRISTDTAVIRETLELLETLKVEIEHITMGIDTVSIVVPTGQVRTRIYDIIAEIKRRARPDRIEMDDNIALIASVGRHMVRSPGIAGKLFHALGKNHINIRMIAQGAEEISIIVGVNNEDFEKTIKVLYNGFIG